MDDTTDFTQWLRTIVTKAGFDLGAGGGRAFAAAAGTDPGQTSRALAGKTKRPSVEYLSAWTRALNARGSQVTMRDMLVRSGWVAPDQLPAGDVAAPSVDELDLEAVARKLGVPADRRKLFVTSVEAVAKTFADEAEGDTVGESQTGGLSARR
jgi:hypothetical protein